MEDNLITEYQMMIHLKKKFRKCINVINYQALDYYDWIDKSNYE